MNLAPSKSNGQNAGGDAGGRTKLRSTPERIRRGWRGGCLAAGVTATGGRVSRTLVPQINRLFPARTKDTLYLGGAGALLGLFVNSACSVFLRRGQASKATAWVVGCVLGLHAVTCAGFLVAVHEVIIMYGKWKMDTQPADARCGSAARDLRRSHS
jgi:hypothetical protein